MTAPAKKVCKDCAADPMILVPSVRPAPFPGPRCHTHHLAFRKATKTADHARKKESQFGLPQGGYAALLEAQDGACGGCGKVPGPRARRMAVDHDHTCCPGNESCGDCVRGLLCYACNDTLAKFRDDEEGLRRLANYLEDWPSKRVRS